MTLHLHGRSRQLLTAVTLNKLSTMCGRIQTKRHRLEHGLDALGRERVEARPSRLGERDVIGFASRTAAGRCSIGFGHGLKIHKNQNRSDERGIPYRVLCRGSVRNYSKFYSNTKALRRAPGPPPVALR